ncbi:MAG: nitroreductase [Acidimicrobiia bacterium]|nr:nitroreductase [Acidimicrobiia bacterium]
MEFTEVARTTFACREFTDDPVPDEVLYRLLDVARFASSGGNRQGWKVIVVKDRDARRRLADLSRPAWALYQAQRAAGESPYNTVVPSAVDPDEGSRRPTPAPLIDALVDVPVLLVVAVDLEMVASIDRDLDRVGVISGASVYPFVWNLLLAARDAGLGGALTTLFSAQEPAAQALLGLPPQVAVAALVPLGRPAKQLTKLTRKPVEAFATVDRFDGRPLTP